METLRPKASLPFPHLRPSSLCVGGQSWALEEGGGLPLDRGPLQGRLWAESSAPIGSFSRHVLSTWSVTRAGPNERAPGGESSTELSSGGVGGTFRVIFRLQMQVLFRQGAQGCLSEQGSGPEGGRELWLLRK